MVIEQIEKKMLSGVKLTSLSDSELDEIAVHFVGDAPPSHVPRETIINILSSQESVVSWQNNLASRAKELANEKISEAVSKVHQTVEDNSDNPMAKMIKERFAKWLQNSGYNATELTTKLDRNADGIIENDEISQFIIEITGNQPPDWVLEHVSSILDSNNDGTILVSELWAYLEDIGFSVPVIDKLPELKENIETQIDEFDELEEELQNDLQIEVNAPEVIDEKITLEEEIITQNESLNLSVEDNYDQVIISTSIEKTIELLGNSRLHSEANTIIANSNSGGCVLKVESVERNLMVNDSYRGGMTLVGLLDGGPFTVSVLFEPEFNDLIDSASKKSQLYSFEAKLFEWSSGLRRAKLKGFNLVLKD